MKQIVIVLIMVTLAGVGCTPVSMVRDEQKLPQVEMKPTTLDAPVMAHEITAGNATEKARQLDQELERETIRRATKSTGQE